jgi:hypothetical protein
MEQLIPIPVGSYNILILIGAEFLFGCGGFTDVQFSLYDKEDCRIGIVQLVVFDPVRAKATGVLLLIIFAGFAIGTLVK